MMDAPLQAKNSHSLVSSKKIQLLILLWFWVERNNQFIESYEFRPIFLQH